MAGDRDSGHGTEKQEAETACYLQAAPIGASTGAMRANWDHTASTYNDFVTGKNFMGPSRDRILAAVATFAKEHKGKRLALLCYPLIVFGILHAAHATSCRGLPALT